MGRLSEEVLYQAPKPFRLHRAREPPAELLADGGTGTLRGRCMASSCSGSVASHSGVRLVSEGCDGRVGAPQIPIPSLGQVSPLGWHLGRLRSQSFDSCVSGIFNGFDFVRRDFHGVRGFDAFIDLGAAYSIDVVPAVISKRGGDWSAAANKTKPPARCVSPLVAKGRMPFEKNFRFMPCKLRGTTRILRCGLSPSLTVEEQCGRHQHG